MEFRTAGSAFCVIFFNFLEVNLDAQGFYSWKIQLNITRSLWMRLTENLRQVILENYSYIYWDLFVIRAQYDREQELYTNKALLSKESKERLELNFMYEPPPGMHQ